MQIKPSSHKVLIIEDDPLYLHRIQNYLKAFFETENQATAITYTAVKQILDATSNKFDIILLDLTLPDLQDIPLLNEVLQLANNIPVVVLSSHENMSFSIKTLDLGASDFLLKEELTAFSLYKAITHNIERKKYILQIEKTRNQYTELFQLSPQPLITYTVDDKKILTVNDAACELYGYTKEEFSQLSLADIRPKSEIDFLNQEFKRILEKGISSHNYMGTFIHQKKHGEIFTVEVYSNPASHLNKNIRISLVNDVSERVKYTQQIEEQNKRLKDIAWIQSHVVRAPLTRIMSLISLFKDVEVEKSASEESFILENIYNSSKELDDVLNDITVKASNQQNVE
ncbi:PAS domain S-box protein [Nonlabens marinus]|uniref:Sensory transduction histidine kinase n=1 Tax=Nonlabens marinus S1-08 TaxID=1454201 RepID=W8VTX9_9FLAO|nr:PAS domain S-box protein [Nonlabens marinus]BAO54098.1 sensory transduction histidine kinase [Nonlabens marinus S1-08]